MGLISRLFTLAILLAITLIATAQEPTLSRLEFIDRADDARDLVRDPMLLAQSPDRPDWAVDDGIIGQDSVTGSSVSIRPRGGPGTNVDSSVRGNERVWIVNTPVQINIVNEKGVVELSADRIVAWTDPTIAGLSAIGSGTGPVEFYLEGNIEFRQDRQTVFAERMYFDVRAQTGVILEAELFSDVVGDFEQFQSPFRVKADVLRLLSPTQFQANNAAFTTSRLGVPRYWVQSDVLSFDTGSTPLINQIARGRFNGLPGDLSQFDQLRVTSENTRLFYRGIPLLRWPRFSADLARSPSVLLKRIRVGNDNIFGAQLRTGWNGFQIFGLNEPENTDWTLTADYLSERGMGFGTDLEYQRDQFFGRPALGRGLLNSWFIQDRGTDNLGRDRRNVPREEDFRGRARWQDRRFFPSGFQLSTELGWVSDRNFLEQYYEEEWDLEKDQDTNIEIKKFNDSGSWSVNAGVRLNDFWTQTEWLPRFDHYELGRGLLDNRFVWFEHSQVGYGRLKIAEPPTNPIDLMKYDPLAWERESEGIRAVTRQEIDMPLQLGAFKVVPYVLGEIGYWQQDLNQEELTRFFGQAGIRASIPFWRVDPTLRNELFNLNGLAHKAVFETEFFAADANANYTDLPLYDQLDDNAVEFARRRYLFDTYGLTFGQDAPLLYDERNFAFRSGMQRNVTSPSAEIADDLMMARFAVRNRWQTRRGVPGRYRTVDVLTLDFETSLFPRSDRDNFGEMLGPTTYDLRFPIGDRTTILSDGYIDFFDGGLRTVSVGAAMTRPGSLQHYLGYRMIEGPISSDILTSSVSYRIGPKWILNYASSFDFGETGNIGQSGSLVRVGESFLVSVGANYDVSRGNVGFRVMIVPRAFNTPMSRIAGDWIAPTGAHGLE